MVKRLPQRHHDVFINCPFDPEYRPLLHAIVFAAKDCGFVTRCALEAQDSGEVRLDRICRMIAECRFAIHDISRIQLDPATGLPRFNMPLELGLFLGAKRFGPSAYARKRCIILDAERYRYQKYCSDISGQDIAAHHNDPHAAVKVIRNWLMTAAPRARKFLAGPRICQRLDAFLMRLPSHCEALALDVRDLTYNDFTVILDDWLQLNPA